MRATTATTRRGENEREVKEPCRKQQTAVYFKANISPTHRSCKICDEGFMCLGASDHRACPPGTSQPNKGQPECDSCVAGKFNAGEGKASCSPCTAGHFCPPSSTSPISCLAGSTYQPEEGKVRINKSSTEECSDDNTDADFSDLSSLAESPTKLTIDATPPLTRFAPHRTYAVHARTVPLEK